MSDIARQSAALDLTQREQVIAQTTTFVKRAEQLFSCKLKPIAVQFDLQGQCAGMFKSEHGNNWIRYNPWIFARYFTDNLNHTVPHEVAHYVVHKLYGRRRVKPHGSQWQQVMVDFGVEPKVTFDYDLTGIPTRQQRRHPYRCPCTEHQLSTTRHHRALRGRGVYHCCSCKHKLVYCPEINEN